MTINIMDFVVARTKKLEAEKAAARSTLDSGTCPTCGQRAPVGGKAALRAKRKWMRKRRAVERLARGQESLDGGGI